METPSMEKLKTRDLPYNARKRLGLPRLSLGEGGINLFHRRLKVMRKALSALFLFGLVFGVTTHAQAHWIWNGASYVWIPDPVYVAPYYTPPYYMPVSPQIPFWYGGGSRAEAQRAKAGWRHR
jgi:hypothetical protein